MIAEIATDETSEVLDRRAPVLVFPLFAVLSRSNVPALVVVDGIPHAALYRSREAADAKRRRLQRVVELPGPAVAAFILGRFPHVAERVAFDHGQPAAFSCQRRSLAAAFRRLRITRNK